MRDVSGNYRLLYKLGRGGMGQVWGGVRLGREDMVMPCAIKVLHPSLADTEQDRQHFFNEARIAAQLDHGRIVKVMDTSEVLGSPCLVMEWVDGVNLREFLEKISAHHALLEIDVCLHVVGEVLAALEYTHERTVGGEDAGVIHYDVTPSNILISSSGEVKLTDFGIARFAAAVDATMPRSMGTPRYMSAEQLSGRARRESDIYSLGVVLHELLEGARFLEGCDRTQMQTLVLEGCVPELTRRTAPVWVDQLRRQMLARRPEDRPRAADARSLILQKTSEYHLAGQQLRELYQRFVGERRSGLTELMNTRDLSLAPRHRRGSLVFAPGPPPTPVLALKWAEGPERTSPCPPVFDHGLLEVVEEVEATEVLEAPAPPPRRSIRLIEGLAGAIVLLIGITLGLFMTGRGCGEASKSQLPAPMKNAGFEAPLAVLAERERPKDTTPSEPASAAALPEVAAIVPEPELVSEPEILPEPEPEIVPEPEPEIMAEPEFVPEPEVELPKPKPKPKPAKVQPRRVEVTFVISGITSAQIQVGSRSLTYDYVAMTKLYPGKYAIRWRESEAQPWRRSGTMIVEELSKGSYYEVRLGPKGMNAKQRTGGTAK